MYAYIDESGNTGGELFDEEQPIFYSCALISKQNIDELILPEVKTIASRVGFEKLHANEMGLSRLTPIIGNIYNLIKYHDLQFKICIIDKKFLALTKYFDSIFDSGENLAVPWHAYNVRQLRYLLLVKFAHLVDENMLKDFWKAYRKRKKEDAERGLEPVLRETLARAPNLPDKRSREIISDSINWALNNPEALYAYSPGKIQEASNFPNIVAFPEILRGIDYWREKWNQPVEWVYHDLQDQFKKAMKYWHGLISNASIEKVNWLGEEIQIGAVPKSNFMLKRDIDSAGLQLVDVILWLTKKNIEGADLSKDFHGMLSYVSDNCDLFDLSYNGLITYLNIVMPKIWDAPDTDEQFRKAKELLESGEERRQKNMKEYAKKRFEISNG